MTTVLLLFVTHLLFSRYMHIWYIYMHIWYICIYDIYSYMIYMYIYIYICIYIYDRRWPKAGNCQKKHKIWEQLKHPQDFAQPGTATWDPKLTSSVLKCWPDFFGLKKQACRDQDTELNPWTCGEIRPLPAGGKTHHPCTLYRTCFQRSCCSQIHEILGKVKAEFHENYLKAFLWKSFLLQQTDKSDNWCFRDRKCTWMLNGSPQTCPHIIRYHSHCSM